MTLTPEQLVEIIANATAMATENGIKIGLRAAQIAPANDQPGPMTSATTTPAPVAIRFCPIAGITITQGEITISLDLDQRHEVCDAMVRAVRDYDKYVYEVCADK